MNEIILEKYSPLEVTPTKASVTVQNTMRSDNQILYISSHGDNTKKWIKIEPGDSVKFGETMYLRQDAFDQWVFPAIEHD